MHNVTPRRVQLTRRRLLQLTGVTATAVAVADPLAARSCPRPRCYVAKRLPAAS